MKLHLEKNQAAAEEACSNIGYTYNETKHGNILTPAYESTITLDDYLDNPYFPHWRWINFDILCVIDAFKGNKNLLLQLKQRRQLGDRTAAQSDLALDSIVEHASPRAVRHWRHSQ